MLKPIQSPCQPERKGVVLLAVLVVLVLLSLAAYNYSDLMVAEYKASDHYHKQAQARAFADSGIHYAMAMLASPDNVASMLNNNPYDNAGVFRNHAVGSGDGQGYFTLVGPLNPNNTSVGTCQFGVIDESAKININAVMAADAKGDKLYKMLLLLPNMTDEIASSIVDWVDTDSTPRQGGAESDYYSGLSPPYACKNGPLESIEELLLVKGVTPQLLFGSDLNRNGYQDAGETDSGTGATSGFDRGWSAYLTIYSREQNVDATGLPLTNLNDSTIDLATMYDTLATNLGEDLAKFIIMYKQLGGSGASGSSTAASGASTGSSMQAAAPSTPATGQSQATTKNTSQGQTQNQTKMGVLSAYKLDTTQAAKQKIKSLYDLINGQVTVSTPSQMRGQPATDTIYKSPLGDPAQQADLLPKLFQTTTVFAATEIPARVNVNTASQEVLTALGFSTADVQAIMAAQPQYGSADPPGDGYETPAWLITQANITPSKLSGLEPMITARSQVYRVQSLGYYDQSKGQVVRLEAVIDTNPVNSGGVLTYQPRILTWRIMSDFGRVRPPQ